MDNNFEESDNIPSNTEANEKMDVDNSTMTEKTDSKLSEEVSDVISDTILSSNNDIDKLVTNTESPPPKSNAMELVTDELNSIITNDEAKTANESTVEENNASENKSDDNSSSQPKENESNALPADKSVLDDDESIISPEKDILASTSTETKEATASDCNKNDNKSDDQPFFSALKESDSLFANESNDIDENSKEIDDNFRDEESLKDSAENLKDIEDSLNEPEENSKNDTDSKEVDENSQEIDDNSKDIDENSKEIDENSKGLDENSKEIDDNSKDVDEPPKEADETEKDDQLANNIEYVDFQENGDKDGSDSQDQPLQSDENPLEDKDDEERDPDQDPIADTFPSETPQGADEELCIIPDMERDISEEEKQAASGMKPLKELASCSTTQTDFDGANQTQPPVEEMADKFIIKKCFLDENQNCMQCSSSDKPNYSVTKGENVEYICSVDCLEKFKSVNENNYILTLEGEIRVKNLSGLRKDTPKLTYERHCGSCSKTLDNSETNLSWEVMGFCNEYCLSKYQKDIGGTCTVCKEEVRTSSLGKYCVRFGNKIRQFCASPCLEVYKKSLKVCSYCQNDISHIDGIVAPVGDKGLLKDFCSTACVEKYDIMSNSFPLQPPEGTTCVVCKAQDKAVTISYKIDDVEIYFCSHPCFVAYTFVNNIQPAKCSMCRRYFPKDVIDRTTMFYDNILHGFCSMSCQSIFIIANRKIVSCAWCRVKKYNFDMICRYMKNGPVLNMCSINCLSFFQVSVNAVHSKKTVCDCCQKTQQPLYHLTMSDASLRNFCSYGCVITFQNKFKQSPITLADADLLQPVPFGEPKKNQKFDKAKPVDKHPSPPPLPIITNVQSLANDGDLPPPPPKRVTRVSATQVTANHNDNNLVAASIQTAVKVKHHIIVKPPMPPDIRNVSTMCKVRTLNKASMTKINKTDKAVQTDKSGADKVIIPVPVPIFIPTPMAMYSVPIPYPLPFPVPIPVPIFIPTTRNSAKGIMKEIKKIQVKIPTDPYEAELLMMAEMVAGEKKNEENTDSESDVDDSGPGPADDGSFSPEPVDASNTFGEDMLQMALKMATEGLEEPAVDLEGALTANTITAPPGGQEPQNSEHVDDPQPMMHLSDRSSNFRGRKRGRGARGSTTPKRRRTAPPVEMQPIQPQPVTPSEPTEKPDAHLCLKYTFGVNAWKQWVTTKNAELEKQTKYTKPFKTEILQLTADELNFSLCLFVKEVRKPNGAEYAPDTIYYLCLGIQQYLFENNRIDNIFCDPYYEQFTDSLDEVARKFSVLYNDSHYIVTRVEEEHLWESKQLGAHSPHVLLSTLMFFNTKHFNLTSVQEHMQLSFSHIMKHWKRNPNQPGVGRVPGSRNVLLRFYPPQSAIQSNSRKKKVYEQQENDDNPLRCPVKLYEFYLSKCPESVKTRNDVFYLLPERSCVPDSPVWYSTSALPQEALEKMLHRVKMVKEINVALLTS